MTLAVTTFQLGLVGAVLLACVAAYVAALIEERRCAKRREQFVADHNGDGHPHLPEARSASASSRASGGIFTTTSGRSRVAGNDRGQRR